MNVVKLILTEEIITECNNKNLIKLRRKNTKLARKRMLATKCVVKKNKAIAKIENYNETIEKYSDETFKSHFRMNRNTFQKLLKELEPFWKENDTGRKKTNMKISLYLTIWRLANQSDTYRELVDRFGVGQGTSHRSFNRVIKILFHLAKKYIKWPTSMEEYQQIIFGFENLRSDKAFPNVIGCVDGTHIQIPTPKKNQKSYYNRKGYHSMLLQGVCDHKLRFTDIFFGWPGRSHDAWVWRNSPLECKLQSGEVVIPQDSHLLGDSAYPLETYLLTPFKDNGFLTRAERNFNYTLSSVRVCIEQAFGLLKGKFRILKCLPIYKLERAKYIVFSCAFLHNFIINNEDIDTTEIYTENNQNVEDHNFENNGITAVSTVAKEKRQALVELFAA